MSKTKKEVLGEVCEVLTEQSKKKRIAGFLASVNKDDVLDLANYGYKVDAEYMLEILKECIDATARKDKRKSLFIYAGIIEHVGKQINDIKFR